MAEWLKGTHDAPDALSRNPVFDPGPHELLADLDVELHSTLIVFR